MSYASAETAEKRDTAAVGWAAFGMAFAIYAATVAPTVTWWDSGELIAAVHSLGIPHPPGTALYVLVARLWTMLLWPLDFAMRVNLFSALATAAAIGIFAVLMSRWTRDSLAGFAAAICAAAGSTVWRNANEAEVYSLALLAGTVVLWAADRAGSTPADRRWRWIFLCCYACGLAWAVHLAALVVLPAAAILIYHRPEGAWRAAAILRKITLGLGVAALGASPVLFLLVRAQHDPSVNQGNPDTLRSLLDVLTRAQYADPGFWPRQAPLWLQLGNWFEYADWQFALGLHSEPPTAWTRTPVTVIYAGLGAVGLWAHRTADRRSWRALLVAFAVAAFAVVLYLNLKAGPSYGYGFLPDGTAREARERDYFFALSFLVWGLWAGFGAVWSARHLAARASVTGGRANAIVGAGIILAALPVALNWRAVDRARGPEAGEARNAAIRILGAAPPRAVLLAAGDNDTYPLWYAQEVESYRRDVAVVTIPLLGAAWYRKEVARRYGLLNRSAAAGWRGLDATLAEICTLASAMNRKISLAPNVLPGKLAPTCKPGL